ncbi:Chemotaxis protein MotB, putative [Umezakia ovalisporum]|uniref:OmpA/MotB family protein n=1 Tax=Umezakia ovalisporum TaxID=75695 RepID=UPI0006F1A286|nr:Chemotaxis protein MotB, putative [Umezakia ovalisporum]
MNDFTDWEQESQTEEDNSSVLLSIGDMMSGLLMIFALLFITVSLQLSQREKPKQDVIAEVISALNSNDVNVEVNAKNGEVTLAESILFAENSAELTPRGQNFLQKFIPVYSNVIFSKPVYEDVITRVVIEGHTSSKGNYNANLQLSLLRSFSVAEYIFSPKMQFKSKSKLSEKIISSGRGEIEARQEIDYPKDRKVTFQLQFKGEDLSDIFQRK